MDEAKNWIVLSCTKRYGDPMRDDLHETSFVDVGKSMAKVGKVRGYVSYVFQENHIDSFASISDATHLVTFRFVTSCS